MAETSIEWTDATWNPIAGCTIMSAGCTNCYAMSIGAEAGPRLGAQSGPLCLRRTISPSELVGVAQTG